MFELFTGMGRSNRMAGVEATAQQAQRTTEHLENQLLRMEERVEKLSMLTLALWTLLKEKTSLTDDELTAAVQSLEKQKEQSAQQALTCPQCGRAMLARDRRCLYCDYREPEADVISQVIR